MTAAGVEASPVPVFTVLVVVGTDHHRFDRLVDWLDEWAGRQTEPTRVVVQHGSARAPRVGQGHALLPHVQLQELMRDATVVVTHGGPATICEAWRHDRMPVVVPRDPSLGEHVDAHQQRFSRRLGSQGMVLLCEQRAELFQALDSVRENPALARFEVGEGRDSLVSASVSRIGAVIDEAVALRASRPSRWRRRHDAGRG